MNIVVIGLGSMGKRRIRLISAIHPTDWVCGVDKRDDRRKEISEMFGIDCFPDMNDINEHIDCAFVCTSPQAHSDIITKCLEKCWHVFTELNLLDEGYDKNIALAKENNCKLFLSSTFLYREEIQYIRSRISGEKHWNYLYHIGQYLPDWHPWESYRDFFIGDKRTNGCREIMAIELPWLTEVFGDVESVSAVSDKMTGLNIDFKDNYLINISHVSGNKGVLVVDVVSPVAVRKFETYAENAYLSWSGTPDSIWEFNPVTKKLDAVMLHEETEHREGYSTFIVENAYKNEIREFFDVVMNDKTAIYGFEQDKEIIKIIDSLGA